MGRPSRNSCLADLLTIFKVVNKYIFHSHLPRIGIIFSAKEHSVLKIEVEREDDGRWIAEVMALPGVLAYGATEADARTRAAALACRVIADLIESGEPVPDEARTLFALV